MPDVFDKERSRALKEINELFSRYRRLNDLDWLLRQNVTTAMRAMGDFEREFKIIMARFYSTKARGPLSKIIGSRTDNFLDKYRRFLSDFNVKGSRIRKKAADRKRIMRATKQVFLSDVINSASRLSESQRTKIRKLKAQQDISSLPASKVNALNKRLVTIEGPSGEGIRMDLREVWNQLQRPHGDFDRIIFADGKKVPIDAFMDMKLQQTEGSVQRSVAQLTSGDLGILTLKVSSHGGKFDCRIWEDAIVWVNETARRLFFDQFKGHPEILAKVRDYPTLQYLENVDRTVIFKFNCHHDADPYPLNFLDFDQILEEAIAPPVGPDSARARRGLVDRLSAA